MEYLYDGSILRVTKPIYLANGRTYRISESYGYMGIDSGVIKITGIVEADNYEGTSLPGAMQSWLDAMCPKGAYDINATYDLATKEELERVLSQPWVMYTHIGTGEEYYMPLEEFIDHISLA